MTSDPLRYVGAAGRRERIVSAVRSQGFVSITALAEELAVSDMTVRRDLRTLDRAGLVRQVHGGVSAPHGSANNASFSARAREQSVAKQALADAAVAMLGPDETVALDAGTTTYAVAEALPEDFGGVVVTNSIPVLQLALERSQQSTIGIGGDLIWESQAFAGAMASEDALRLRVDTFFLGAAAVDEHGVYVAADIERPLKSALMRSADRVILLVDHTKLDKHAPVRLCGLDQLDVIVSNRQPSGPLLAALASLPVTLHVSATA